MEAVRDKTDKAGFEFMGQPVNESFLLTGFGPITDSPEIDPGRKSIAYMPSRKPIDREEGREDNDSPMDSAEKMICKFLGMRDERNALHEKCLDI